MLSGNTYWERLRCKSMGISIMPHSSSQMSDTFPGPVSAIIAPLQLLAFGKLSSSPSLNKFNRLTERQPDAPCWLSKGLRWDNIMVCKAHMAHFRCVMGENSNLSHKWQFFRESSIPHRESVGLQQRHETDTKKRAHPQCDHGGLTFKKTSTLKKTVIILKDMFQ